MNRFMSKALAIGVALTMLFGTATAFAADGLEVEKTKPAGKQDMQVSMDGSILSDPAAVLDAERPKAAKSIMNTSGLEPVKAKTLLYTTDQIEPVPMSFSANSSGSYDVYPVTASTSGKLVLAAAAPASSSTKSIRVAVGTVSGTVFSIQSSKYVYQDGEVYDLDGIDVVPGKTYYVGFSCTEAGSIVIGAGVYSYASRTLPQGKIMLSSGIKGSSDATVTYRIVPSQTGYITVALNGYGKTYTSGNVTLLNSKSKVVSDTLSYNSGSKTGYVVFGVKKGTTYYLRVANCKGTYDNKYVYGIKYTTKAGKIRKNKKKKKAVKLKRKKKATKTTIVAKGKSGKDWYKFKVTKKRKTQVRVDATNVKSGSLKIILYKGKKKIATKAVTKGYVNTFTVTHSTTWGKANKGTYYVVIKKSARTNGQYTIRYLK